MESKNVWNTYKCNYSGSLGWIEKNIAEENFAYLDHIIIKKDLVNKNPNIVFFDNQDDIYHSINFTPYKILGEPIEISYSIKPVYSPLFVKDEYGFIHYVRTSLQSDRRIFNIL